MAKYELEDLLRVRHIRKDRAAKELKDAKELLVQAEQAVAKAKQELEDYKVFVKNETVRLYNEIMNKTIHRNDIDSLNFMIKELHSRIFEYERRVESAIAECDKAKENVENKREALRQAERNIDKIQTLKDRWIEEMKFEEERKMDAEAEDLVVKAR